MSSTPDDFSWLDTARVTAKDAGATVFEPHEDLLAPRTQIVGDSDTYLGQGRHDVGRRISTTQVELFISTDVATALSQEFAQHTPDFLALHDIGTNASLRLLKGLAGAAGTPVQRLSVRRQGLGVALAVLPFVDVGLADGSLVRVYSTDVNTDSQTRSQLAHVLLAFSRLGALLVGELPPHAVNGQLAPLHDALLRGPWPNRELLMVPLGSSTALAAQAAQLAASSSVSVRVTPQAGRPSQAWTYIGGAWNLLHSVSGSQRALDTELSRAVPRPRAPVADAATEPMDLSPLPEPKAPVQPLKARVPVARPMPLAGATRWQEYADRCAAIKGAVSCCVFEIHSASPLAHAGGAPAAERLAQQGATLLVRMNEATRALGLGHGPTQAEATVSAAGHHLLLRPVPGHPGVAVHLVLSATTGNVTLARLQLERIDSPQ